MKRSKVEIFSVLNLIIGILFYFLIFGENIPWKKILLVFLIILNIISLIVNLKNINKYRADTYLIYKAYISNLEFVMITVFLETLELIM